MSNTIIDSSRDTDKQAGLGSWLGKLWQGTNNPYTSTLGRALLLGGAGYGAGRLGAAVLDKDKKYDANRIGMATALGLMPLALHGNGGKLWWNLKGKHAPGVSKMGNPYENMPITADSTAADRANKMLGEKSQYPNWYNALPTMEQLKNPTPVQPGSPVYANSQPDIPVSIKMSAHKALRRTLRKKAFVLKLQEKRAALDYGESGIGGSFATFLPPESVNYGIPARYTMQQLDADPYMGPASKARLKALIERGSSGKSGLISWGDIARGAVGTGIGYGTAALAGKTLGAIYGGVSPIVQRRLQQAGAVAGLLSGTGILR